MHKKRAVIVSAVVFIVVLATILIASQHYYYSNSQKMVNALKVMRSEPEKGLELCGELSIEDYARDCYTAYLSSEIERIRAENTIPEDASEQEKRDARINTLNEISSMVDDVCNRELMSESSACSAVRASIGVQMNGAMNS